MNPVQIMLSVVGKLMVPSASWLMLGVCGLRVLHEGLFVPVLLYGNETDM